MTDLLDQLRALNPVDRDAVDVPPALEGRVLRAPPPRPSRRLRWAGVAAAAVAVLVVVAVVVSGRGTPDLASRAYAAITGPGVVHWRTEIVNFANGRPTVRQRQEGWAAGGVQHVVDYALPQGRPRLVTDTVITRDRQTSYSPASDHVFTGPAPKLATSAGVVYGDPMEAFRLAERAGELVPVGPNRYRVDPSRLPGSADRVEGQTWTYVLDPRTARPTDLILTSNSVRASNRRYRTEFRFAVYERLPDTADNRTRLRALPRRAPSRVDPAVFFGVLRTGSRPTSAQRAAARLLVAHGPFELDLRRARAAGRALVIPGRNGICVQVDSGGACNGLRPSVRHGLTFGGSSRGAWMLVPDGVASVRARLPRHPWRTFPVHHNIVRLPNGGYHATFTPPARLLDKLD